LFVLFVQSGNEEYREELDGNYILEDGEYVEIVDFGDIGEQKRYTQYPPEYTLTIPEDLEIYELPRIIKRINSITFGDPESLPIQCATYEVQAYILQTILYLYETKWTKENRDEFTKDQKRALKNYYLMYVEYFGDEDTSPLGKIETLKPRLEQIKAKKETINITENELLTYKDALKNEYWASRSKLWEQNFDNYQSQLEQTKWDLPDVEKTIGDQLKIQVDGALYDHWKETISDYLTNFAILDKLIDTDEDLYYRIFSTIQKNISSNYTEISFIKSKLHKRNFKKFLWKDLFGRITTFTIDTEERREISRQVLALLKKDYTDEDDKTIKKLLIQSIGFNFDDDWTILFFDKVDPSKECHPSILPNIDEKTLLNNILEQVDEATPNLDKAQFVFDEIRKFRSSYSNKYNLSQIFEDNQTQCMLNTVLSHTILDELDIEHTVINWPTHVALILYIDSKKYYFDPSTEESIVEIQDDDYQTKFKDYKLSNWTENESKKGIIAWLYDNWAGRLWNTIAEDPTDELDLTLEHLSKTLKATNVWLEKDYYLISIIYSLLENIATDLKLEENVVNNFLNKHEENMIKLYKTNPDLDWIDEKGVSSISYLFNNKWLEIAQDEQDYQKALYYFCISLQVEQWLDADELSSELDEEESKLYLEKMLETDFVGGNAYLYRNIGIVYMLMEDQTTADKYFGIMKTMTADQLYDPQSEDFQNLEKFWGKDE